MEKDDLKKTIDNLWPKTKKELEKAVKNTKEVIAKGESYIKTMSSKSIDKTRKISLSVKREKLYYTLGKDIVKTPKSKWVTDKKITELVRNIKALSKEIKKI